MCNKKNGDSNPQETLLYSNPKIIQEDELFNGYKNPKQFQLFQRGNNLIESIKQHKCISISIILGIPIFIVIIIFIIQKIQDKNNFEYLIFL